MSRLTRDGTAEPVLRDQILRRERGQGNIHFPCSADHEQDWQPYPVDPFYAICDDHTYILLGYSWPSTANHVSRNVQCFCRLCTYQVHVLLERWLHGSIDDIIEGNELLILILI